MKLNSKENKSWGHIYVPSFICCMRPIDSESGRVVYFVVPSLDTVHLAAIHSSDLTLASYTLTSQIHPLLLQRIALSLCKGVCREVDHK